MGVGIRKAIRLGTLGGTAWLCVWMVPGWAGQTPGTDLPQWDTSNGIPITQQIRQQQIETELAELGEDHPWAGRYTFGDGLGVNQSLLIAPRNGFVVTWHGCMGLYGTNEGQISDTGDGRLLLHFLWANRPGGFGSFPRELLLVPWGERQFLVPPAELIEFVSAVNHHGFDAAKGLYFKRTTPALPVTGRPLLPAHVADQLREQPLLLSVTAAGPLTTTQLSWGACSIRRDLWLDIASASALEDGLELRPAGQSRSNAYIVLAPADGRGRVAKWQTTADEDCQIDPELMPEVGWIYSTGAFDPEATPIPRDTCAD